MLTRNGEYGCRYRVSAGLPGLVQPRGHRQQRPGRRDRWLDAQHADRRVYLREGQEVRRACVRRRAAAISGRPHRAERTRPLPSRRLGRGDRIDCDADARDTRALGRRSHPSVFLWRIKRAADAGHARCRALPTVRHVAAGSHSLRGSDRRCGAGALRQDAVGHLRGLPGREADHPVGRQPVNVWHPSRAVRARGAKGRGAPRSHRSAIDSPCTSGRSPPGAPARHRCRHRARDPSPSVRERARRHGIPRHADEGRRPAARASGSMDVRARGRDFGRARSGPAAAGGGLRAHVPGADSLRLGSRA